jgi:lytic cellulose monooxygenase (C1-hydroxylating)
MKTSLFSLSAFLSLLATQINAHATFQEFWVGSTDMVGTCVRLPFNNSPVTSVTSTDIACNANAATSPGYCSVAAGGAVTVEMHQQVR